ASHRRDVPAWLGGMRPRLAWATCLQFSAPSAELSTRPPLHLVIPLPLWRSSGLKPGAALYQQRRGVSALQPGLATLHEIPQDATPLRHVSRILRTRSTNRLSRLLSVPPLPFRHRTACRKACSAALFVGSTPSCHTNAPKFGSLAVRLRHVAAAFGQPQIAPCISASQTSAKSADVDLEAGTGQCPVSHSMPPGHPSTMPPFYSRWSPVPVQ